MKILRVRLENLNSLRGTHEIDFSEEPIASAGIFAITGPTGAGKSTLLDAITLALYGRAARYDSPNPADMMSRHCGECQAEVEFEVRGERYRAEWQLRRARGKPEGKVQPAQRFIYDATGTVLTQKLREADEKIEELTGLNHDRFMRSALLAQGQFARFLQAKADERAALLESLTATAIYSELSQRAFTTYTERHKALELRRTKLGLIQALEPEARKNAQTEVKTVTAALTKLRSELKGHTEQIARAENLAKQIASDNILKKKAADLTRTRERKKSDLQRLQRYRLAEPFLLSLSKADDASTRAKAQAKQAEAAKQSITTLTTQRAQILAAAGQTGAQLQQGLEKELEDCRRKETAAAKQRDAAQQWLKDHQNDANLAKNLPTITGALEALSHSRKAEQSANAELKKRQSEQTDATKKQQQTNVEAKAADKKAEQLQSKADKAQAATKKQLDGQAIEDWRERGSRFSTLINASGQQKEQQKELTALQKQLTKLESELSELDQKEKAARKQCSLAEELLEARQKNVSDAQLIANYETQRESLANGAACPLCGATEHPYCDDHAPPEAGKLEKQVTAAREELTRARKAHDEISQLLTKQKTSGQAKQETADKISTTLATLDKQLATEGDALGLATDEDPGTALKAHQTQLKALEKSIKDSEATSQEARDAKAEAKRMHTALAGSEEALQKLTKDITATQKQQTSTEKEAARQLKTVTDLLKPLGLEAPVAGKEIDTREALTERHQTYAAKLKASEDATAALKEAQQHEIQLKKDVAALSKRRASLSELQVDPPSDDPGEFQFDDLDSAGKTFARTDKELTSAQSRQKELQNGADTSDKESKALLNALAKELDGSEFSSIEDLRGAAVPKQDLAALQTMATELTEAEQRNAGAIERCQADLKELRGANILEGAALIAAQTASADLETKTTAQTKTLASLEESLRRDDEAIATCKKIGAELEQDLTDLKAWEQLNGLIGSADGKKFRVFAQGLTLDILLRHANRHLDRLRKRYQLARSESEALGLDIIDHYQASTRRPMASLSGGESFLASLALALGLSDLAGRNVQIDSLFIDEGFGTLDADALDVAISALESLRGQDKTVGVISHIDLLKERIATQIAIEPSSGGSSSIRVIGG